MSKNKSLAIYIFIIFILTVACIVVEADISLCFMLITWLSVFFYALSDLVGRTELIGFLISFFVFLIGGQIAITFFGYEYNTMFSQDLERHANQLLIISLISLFFGYFITSFFKNESNLKYKEQKKDIWKNIVRQISSLVFYFTAIFWFLILFEKISYVDRSGYLALYSHYSTNYPYIVSVLADFAPIAFYMFLATYPSKKQIKWPMIVYILYSVMSLLTGRRILVAINILMIMLYIFTRSNEDNERWITRKYIIILCITFPLIIIVMQLISDLRMDNEFQNEGIVSVLIDFLGDQGFTVNLIKYEPIYESALGENKYYTFYNTIRFFRTNPLTSWFMPQDYGFTYGTYTAENAVYGNSFANAISYIVAPYTFLSGGGTGSCYIAELFHDFSYFGVVIGNVVYGVLLKCMRFMRGKGILLFTVYMIILENMFKAPRYNYDVVVGDLTSITRWLIIIAILIFSYFLYRRLEGE